MKRIYVYIAGPFTQGDQWANVARAADMAEAVSQIKVDGYTFIPFIPHTMTALWHYKHPHDYDFWMEYTEAWLAKCDCLLLMPGRSHGATEEAKQAMIDGKMVFHTVSQIASHYEDGHYKSPIERPTLL